MSVDQRTKIHPASSRPLPRRGATRQVNQGNYFLLMDLRRNDDPDPRSYFFDSGIRFRCRECGTCCTGSPGVVRVTGPEIRRIAAYLRIEQDVFAKNYLRDTGSGQSIREDTQGRCLFFNDGCTIYQVRPRQCRSYPFWFRNMRNEDTWRQTARECPGIGSGRLYSREEILASIGENLEASGRCVPDAP